MVATGSKSVLSGSLLLKVPSLAPHSQFERGVLPLTIFDTVAQADGDPLQRPTLLLCRLDQGFALLDDIDGHDLDGLVRPGGLGGGSGSGAGRNSAGGKGKKVTTT